MTYKFIITIETDDDNNVIESDSYIEKLCKYTQYTKDINDKMLCCLELSSIKEVNNNLNVQALLKNLFFDYTYARRAKIINTMFSNFTEQKKILSKDQLYKMSRRLEKITGAKSRIKPDLLAEIFERNIEYIGSLA